MINLSTKNLDLLVEFIDNECNGNAGNPEISEKFNGDLFTYKTKINQTLDPFGNEYFNSQIRLYEEISGRNLDQWSGELHQVNIDDLLRTSNPQGIYDVNHVAENVRSLSSMLSLSNLKTAAKVLDLGAGHGLSSEVYAFCGASVSAIDIDPLLSELSEKRAKARYLNINRIISNFDNLDMLEDRSYDAAFFFQSLHHALHPHKLISELKKKLSDDGVIAFSGEPINAIWWKHWGIRLDFESLYVARKFGWFESGWSIEYITECFKRNGFNLLLMKGGTSGSLIGITSKNANRIDQMYEKAVQIGFFPDTNVVKDSIIKKMLMKLPKPIKKITPVFIKKLLKKIL